MPSWRDDKILELANQLTYSPAEKRREQLHAAMQLLPAIDPAKSYPWDFVHFRITSFQSRTHIDHVVAGKILRADLASLIEFLSDTLSLKIDDAVFGGGSGDAVLELDDVMRKFNVSSKTIQRWRKQGLIALRYLYADEGGGRRRLGFLESAVATFAAANKDLVERSATFKQLSDDEKSAIIALARALIAKAPAHGETICIKDLSRLIAQKLGRAPETIRYTIRKYDLDHPEAAIFPDPEAPSRRASNLNLNLNPNLNPDPAPTLEPSPTLNRDPAPIAIDYVPNPLFDHPDADNIILQVLPAEALAKAQATVTGGTNSKTTDVYMARMPCDLPAFLADIFRQPVMPHEIETDAFRRMNYLKYKAARLQASLDPAAPPATAQAQAEQLASLLQQSNTLKNTILQGNLRVAVHVARKHQRPDRPLIELVSDATIWVMRAIERFDFSRPTRFSTYAGYAIMKNFARDRAEQLTRRDDRLVTGQDELLNAVGDTRQPGTGTDPLADQLDAATLQSELRCVIDDLPARDKELLCRHYGLDQNKPALSLSEIGDQMGLTKTRVRQLEARALRKLRHLMEARRQKIRTATAKRP